ncbi:MAG: hypothetical protein IPO14_03420 [Saprospiraceae bacterium]|jgi:hypothetical protein|nr:hypothetical protein [Saprospiraceae bacterium]
MLKSKKFIAKFCFSIALICLCISYGSGQTEDSMLDDIAPDSEQTTYSTNAFKSPRVINSNSIEMLRQGVLDFRILHRFGLLSGGGYELFGLDQATMRMAFDYGITNQLMVGVGRSTNKKELDGFVKYRILQQSTGKRNMPISLVWASGIMVNGLKDPFGLPDSLAKFKHRLSFYHQLIVGRKFNDKFSLQLSPMLVHQNLTSSIVQPNEIFALGLGTRFKITKRVALTLDTYYTFNKFINRINELPLALGVDIETGGHVFQIHLSNATGMNERAFISDSNGDFFKGDFRIGFNLSRWFQIARSK